MYKTRTRILQGWNAGETVPKAVGCLDNGDPADGFQDQSENHGGYCGWALSSTFTSFFFLENLGSYKQHSRGILLLSWPSNWCKTYFLEINKQKTEKMI